MAVYQPTVRGNPALDRFMQMGRYFDQQEEREQGQAQDTAMRSALATLRPGAGMGDIAKAAMPALTRTPGGGQAALELATGQAKSQQESARLQREQEDEAEAAVADAIGKGQFALARSMRDRHGLKIPDEVISAAEKDAGLTRAFELAGKTRDGEWLGKFMKGYDGDFAGTLARVGGPRLQSATVRASGPTSQQRNIQFLQSQGLAPEEAINRVLPAAGARGRSSPADVATMEYMQRVGIAETPWDAYSMLKEMRAGRGVDPRQLARQMTDTVFKYGSTTKPDGTPMTYDELYMEMLGVVQGQVAENRLGLEFED